MRYPSAKPAEQDKKDTTSQKPSCFKRSAQADAQRGAARTGQHDFSDLPMLEYEGLSQAVVPTPPCTLMVSHEGKQLGFFLLLDLDLEVAKITGNITLDGLGTHSTLRADTFEIIGMLPSFPTITEGLLNIAMIQEFARRFAVRREKISEEDDWRQPSMDLHDVCRVLMENGDYQ